MKINSKIIRISLGLILFFIAFIIGLEFDKITGINSNNGRDTNTRLSIFSTVSGLVLIWVILYREYASRKKGSSKQ